MFQQLDFPTFQKKIGRQVVDGTVEYELWQQRQQISKMARLLHDANLNAEYWANEVIALREFLDGFERKKKVGLSKVEVKVFVADKRGSSIRVTTEIDTSG